MTLPWTVVTPWGAVRAELVLAGASAVLAVVVMLVLVLRRRRRRGADANAAGTAARTGGRDAAPLAAAPSSVDRLRRGLGKTRDGLLARLAPVLGRNRLDPAAMDDIETALLAADV